MADFLTDLWTSVFTPGATPTLLVATNLTFAALQALLLALLIATYSIHFAILSVLSAGLWWSINWFATELRAAQAKEEEAERIRKQKKPASAKTTKEWREKGEVGDSADDEGEDTETETEGPGLRDSVAGAPEQQQMKKSAPKNVESGLGAAQAGGSGTTGVDTAGAGGVQARRKKAEDVDRSGEVSSSTDSEWEKVEGDRRP
jgi:hypothetical protein